jgi:hypothetical protein
VTRKVILHVGTPKTGTSYLQHVLFKNKRLLGEHGILYPATGSTRTSWPPST